MDGFQSVPGAEYSGICWQGGSCCARAPARVCPGYLISPRPCWCLCVRRPSARACPTNRAAPTPTASGRLLPPCPQASVRGHRHPLPWLPTLLSPHLRTCSSLPATRFPFPHQLFILRNLGKLDCQVLAARLSVPVAVACVPQPMSPHPGCRSPAHKSTAPCHTDTRLGCH